jgi:hypothetical protein
VREGARAAVEARWVGHLAQLVDTTDSEGRVEAETGEDCLGTAVGQQAMAVGNRGG